MAQRRSERDPRYPHLWKWDGKWEARPGVCIHGAIEDGCALAQDTETTFTMELNGVSLTFTPFSDPDQLHREWMGPRNG